MHVGESPREYVGEQKNTNPRKERGGEAAREWAKEARVLEQKSHVTRSTGGPVNVSLPRLESSIF